MSESTYKSIADKSQLLLESDNVVKSIIAISLPMMVSGFVDALYNAVDSIFVGRFVGEYALAALAVNNVIQIALLAVGGLFGVGITSIISRALGSNDLQKVKTVLVNGVFLGFFLTLLMSLIFLLFLDPILRFMGSSEEVLHYSREYASVILWGGFIVPVNTILLGAMRAKGHVQYVMQLGFLGAMTNIILDFLFIVYFRWEVIGAASATIIAQLCVLIISIKLVSRIYSIKFRLYYLRDLTYSLVSEIFSIGITNFLRVFTFVLMNITANRVLSFYGTAALASFGIINRILHLAYQPIFGSNLGTQALIGYNYGANHFLKVKKIIIQGIFLATLIGIIPSILFISAPQKLFALFTDSVSIMTYVQDASRIIGFTFFLYGVQAFSTGALVAMGHPREALLLSLFRPCVMVICMNILPFFFQEFGIWYSFPLTDILSTIFSTYIIIHEIMLLKKRESIYRSL